MNDPEGGEERSVKVLEEDRLATESVYRDALSAMHAFF
jgi:hypothetical protein